LFYSVILLTDRTDAQFVDPYLSIRFSTYEITPGKPGKLLISGRQRNVVVVAFVICAVLET